MNTYLDGCLAEPATKALLVQSRTEAGLTDLVAARNQRSAALMLPDLVALGWAPPEPIAALFVAAIAEIALVELDAGQRDDELRRGLLRLATGDRGYASLSQRPQTGTNQIQTCGHQFTEVARTTIAAPILHCHNKSRRECGSCDFGDQIDVGHVRVPVPDEFGQHVGKRRLHHPQMTRDTVRTDQLGAGGRRLADDFKIVREGGNTGQHRIEQRLRGATLRKCLGQPFQVRLVILEQHRLLGWEMPEESAFGNAGLSGQLGHGHVRKSLAGKAF